MPQAHDSPALDHELGSALRRSRRRAKLLTSLLVLCGLFYAPVIGSLGLKIRLQQRAAAGDPPGEAAALVSDGILGVSLLAEMLLMVGATIVWFFWLHRAYANLLLIGERKARFSPGWAVGSWFVPFLNLFRAYQVMKDLWWRSESGNSGFVMDDAPGPNAITAWWGTYLVSHLVWRATEDRRVGLGPEVELWGMLASSALDLIAAALAFVVVRTIRDYQDRWLEIAAAEPIVAS